MAETDYWEECITQSLEEHGVAVTPDQIKAVASDVQGAHEQHGMAFGHDAIPDPRENELRDLKRDLECEREKVFCRACGGRGRIIERFGTIESNMQCGRCNGEGRHDPRRSHVPR